MELRAFVAVELEPRVRQELARLERRLQDAPSSHLVRWVAPQNIHLTLKFLGNVNSELIPALTAALADAAQPFAPFDLRAEVLGAFPNMHRPNNIWVGLTGETRQAALLARAIQDSCARLGLPRDAKDLALHLTLGRVKHQATTGERAAIGSLIRASHPTEPIPLRVEQFALISSVLRPNGPIYTKLSDFKLNGTALS